MDYLISPFGFPPVGHELPKKLDDQLSVQNINSAYTEVFSLLKLICEQNLWRHQFQDKERVEQTRFFSNGKYYFLSGYQIRGLAELHLALKFHLDTELTLEESRSGYSGIYCFDLQAKIDKFENNRIFYTSKSEVLVATWTTSELNADLSLRDHDKPYKHASYPLFYIKLSQAHTLNLVSYEDFFPLFKDMGIQDLKNKKSILNFFESFIFEEQNLIRVEYTKKNLINAKILMLHIIGRFLCIETHIICDYLDTRLYAWNKEVSGDYTMFFSTVLNAVFGLIDELIIKKEKTSAKAININKESIYELFKLNYLYDFEQMESSDIVDQLNSDSYQPIDDNEITSTLQVGETDLDYNYVSPELDFAFDTALNFPQQENSDAIEFLPITESKSSNSFSLEPLGATINNPLSLCFDIEESKANSSLTAGLGAKKILVGDLFSIDSEIIAACDKKTLDDNHQISISVTNTPSKKDVPIISLSNSDFPLKRSIDNTELPSPFPSTFSKLSEPLTEKQILDDFLNEPYDHEAKARININKNNLNKVLLQKEQEVEAKVNEFEGAFDLGSVHSFITEDTAVKHSDIVKKVTESRELVNVEEKRKAVEALHDAVKISHPFIPRLSDVAAWTVLTKKWLHLLTFVESNKVLNLPIANRSTYFDLMCLKQNILKSWSKLESGYLQHKYLKTISFDVFNMIFETWEYRQFIDDMAKVVIEKSISLTKVHCAFNLVTHETIEYSKLTEDEINSNMFSDAYKYKFDIILPEMRRDKISDLKTAFNQLYDNVQSNYLKVFGKYPGASHIFRMTVVIYDLLILNMHQEADYSLEIQDDIFSVLSEFKADFNDARDVNSFGDDKFYIQSILTDIEPFIRRRIGPETFLSF